MSVCQTVALLAILASMPIDGSEDQAPPSKYSAAFTRGDAEEDGAAQVSIQGTSGDSEPSEACPNDSGQSDGSSGMFLV